MSRAKHLIPFVPYIVVSVVHVILIVFDLPGRGFETKQLLMPALALALVWSLWNVRPWPRPAVVLVLIALASSWIGDGAGLFFPELPTLPMMILWFAIAHLAYIALFLRAPGMAGARSIPKWALIYVLWWVVTVAIVGPHAGALLIPLAIYGVVLGGTAATSTKLGPLVAWGGVSFLASDTLIAYHQFMGMPQRIADLTIMPTYEIGQGLIVYGVVALLRASAKEAGGQDAGVGEAAASAASRGVRTPLR